MTMKQTQTKMFDFSDTGLDFSTVSANLFLDRFKKMLSSGYNTQTVSSVTVAGNQVTLQYGANHGYVADRVLQINAQNLSGEYVIDSVTTNTVTLTIENAPSSIAGNFTTKVASLGWELVYELNQVQIYKLKDLDDTPLYLRLLFPKSTEMGIVHPCIGKSFNATTGVIDDPFAHTNNKDILSPNNDSAYLKFSMYNYSNVTPFANYTYNQGVQQGLGKAMVIGSNYHFALLNNVAATDGGAISAIIPSNLLNYNNLSYPVLLGCGFSQGTTMPTSARLFCSNIELSLLWTKAQSTSRFATTTVASQLPASLDNFNTTAAFPLVFKEYTTHQAVGMSIGGAFHCGYALNASPSRSANSSPSITSDVDFKNNMLIHYIGNASDALYLAFPLEKVKYAN